MAMETALHETVIPQKAKKRANTNKNLKLSTVTSLNI